MSKEGIQISVEDLRDAATKLKGINDRITNDLNTIKKQMDGLDSWQGDAHAAIKDKFSSLYPKFKILETTLNGYISFLGDTANAYTTNESDIKKDANSDIEDFK